MSEEGTFAGNHNVCLKHLTRKPKQSFGVSAGGGGGPAAISQGQGTGRAWAASGWTSPHCLAQPLCLPERGSWGRKGSGRGFRVLGVGGLQAFPQGFQSTESTSICWFSLWPPTESCTDPWSHPKSGIKDLYSGADLKIKPVLCCYSQLLLLIQTSKLLTPTCTQPDADSS